MNTQMTQRDRRPQLHLHLRLPQPMPSLVIQAPMDRNPPGSSLSVQHSSSIRVQTLTLWADEPCSHHAHSDHHHSCSESEPTGFQSDSSKAKPTRHCHNTNRQADYKRARWQVFTGRSYSHGLRCDRLSRSIRRQQIREGRMSGHCTIPRGDGQAAFEGHWRLGQSQLPGI